LMCPNVLRPECSKIDMVDVGNLVR
jgi:hypothetical protein